MNPSICIRSAAAVTAALLAGCTPLQQAPLVYSSKVVVGLDVSANVSENQGGSINIGVKTIDSAYVPVAVSKEIDKKAKDGAETTPGLSRIEAKYGDANSSESSDGATDDRNRKLDAYFAAKKAADDAVNEVAKADAAIGLLTRQIAQLDSQATALRGEVALPEVAAAGSPQPARRAALVHRAGELAKLNSDQNYNIRPLGADANGAFNTSEVLADLDGLIVGKKAQIDKVNATLPGLRSHRDAKVAEADRAKAEAARVAGLSQTNKTDAMSVYGRFDSNGTGGTKDGATASLLIGKVFSTGLASQNLTEAVKLEAASRCIANTLELAKMQPEAERKKFVDTFGTMCLPPLNGQKK